MARPATIDQKDVDKACKKIIASGDTPTVDRIRGELGTGSKTTILRMRNIFLENEKQKYDIKFERTNIIEETIDDLFSLVASEYKTKIQKLEHQLNIKKQETSEYLKETEEYLQRHEEIKEKYEDLKIHNVALNKDLADYQKRIATQELEIKKVVKLETELEMHEETIKNNVKTINEQQKRIEDQVIMIAKFEEKLNKKG